ncbi:MAG: hypothetical protein FJW96_16720 [Actinobacteria bacterium]|nr:hypothetical protein [Actinomycetota bacterium]
MPQQEVLEHGETSADRRLRSLRLRIALGIAVVEGIVVIAGGVPWWLIVVLALVAVGVHLGYGRAHPRSRTRSITWIAAVSQLVVVLVPAVLAIALALAVLVVVLCAIVLLVGLLVDRR